MENKSFDDIIKAKLEGFSSESAEGAWELFSQVADADALDQELISRLSGHKEALPDGAWTSFIASDLHFDNAIRDEVLGYDSGEIPTDFDEISDTPTGFDALIGAKLAAMAVNDGADWDAFEKILDGEDVRFDEEVRDKVDKFETPVSESQWPKLSEHLERLEKRRRRIVITKFVEAAIFILFFMTIAQLYPIDQVVKRETYRTHGVVQAMENGGSEDLYANVTLVEDELLVEKTDEVQDILESSNMRAELPSANRSQVENVDLLARRTLALESGRREIVVSADANKRKVAELPEIKKTELLDVFYEQPVVRLNADKDEGKVVPTLLLASLDLAPLETNRRRFAGPVLDLASKIKNGQYYFSMYGSPQANMISTPYDVSYSDRRSIVNEEEAIEAYSHLADGYTVGASISKENAMLEIEGGIEYTSLNYKPFQVTERVSTAAAGYKEFTLKEIIFDLVEIPLNIKYNLFKKKGWKVYGVNGVSVGIVANANFDIDENSFKPLAAASIPGQPRSGSEQSFVNRKKFLPGVLNSREDFLENTYATVNVGMGVSKEISDKISFYVQPTYYHNLSQSGIGPNNDVHHRLAMQIGTKVRI